MNLLNLAPDIQEELLFQPRVMMGRAQVTERELRAVCGVADWAGQRKIARKLQASWTQEPNP